MPVETLAAQASETRLRRASAANHWRTNMSTKANHTPGPWHCNLGTGTNLTNDPSIWADNAIVALAGGPDDSGYTDTTIANARLIAAAPELLAACKAAVGALSQPVQTAGHETPHTCMILRGDAKVAVDCLRAAIAKATREVSNE